MRPVAASVLLSSLLVVGLCASVFVVGLRLAAPDNSVIGPAPPDLEGAENVQISSASGSLLRGWWIPSRQSVGGGVVVLMHGVHSNRLSMLQRARVLRDHGFAVLLFDFEAEGESPGRHITFGRLEALDAVAVVAFARRRMPAEKVGAIGTSLGGAAALLGPEPLPVDSLVLESVYSDIEAALSNRLRASLGPILGSVFTPLLTPAFELLLPPVIGVAPDQLRPIDHIGSASAPLLIASGTNDDRTPINEAHALFDHAPTPKQFWAVKGAGHVDLEHYDSVAYWRVVMPFLSGYLQAASAGMPSSSQR